MFFQAGVPEVQFSVSFLKTLITGLGGELPKDLSKPLPLKTDGDWVLYNAWNVKRPWKGNYGEVQIWCNKVTGKFKKEFHPFYQSWITRHEIIGKTTAVMLLYGIEEAETKARQKLESMLSSKQRRSYLLCDSFYEKRPSGILYWLRKNRPTIALRLDEDSKSDGKGTPLCALCLHPLGWYTGSFAGIMAPSDDLIAQLLMIRANEHLFWRKANQHSLDSVLSGI